MASAENQSVEINLAEVVPQELRNLHQWVNWKREAGESGLQTKVPYCPAGFRASTKKPDHWRPFIVTYLARQKFHGIGFILAESDGYVGLDLDGCIDDQGDVLPWAIEIIKRLEGVAYGEVSPSGKGIKFLTRARKPTNKCVYKIPKSTGKQQIECYEKRRFWTITGRVYGDKFTQIGDGQAAIDWLSEKYLKSSRATVSDSEPKPKKSKPSNQSTMIVRASRYLATMDAAIQGQGGSVACLKAALAMIKGFGLSKGATFDLLANEYNHRCVPPWSEAELLHKINSAAESTELPEGYLLTDDSPDALDSTEIVIAKGKPPEEYIEEADDDPQRLARINIEKYRKEHSGRLVYWRDEWWKWKEGRYRKIELPELRAKVWQAVHAEFVECYKTRRAAGDDKPVRKVSRAIVSNVIGAMESICALPDSVMMPSWLPDRTERNYLAVKNGVLDMDRLFQGEDDCLRPLSDDWFCGFQLDYPFDPEADCPLWIRFIHSAMDGDQERIDILQEWAGYCLTGRNEYQRFLAMEGDGGNGKTVYTAGITAMLGSENISRVALEKFGGQFDLSTTIGKAVNICGDVGELDRAAEAELKQFTGGDVMQFDRKNKQPMTARPTAKLILSWNLRPRFADRSDGLWRRMVLIPFNHKPKSNEIVRGMDDAKWWIENGQAPGILLWAIAGLRRLRDQGDFTKSKVVQAAVLDYQIGANPALEFLTEYVEADEFSKVSKIRLYELYEHFCKKTGHKYPLAQRQFGREVKKRFPDAIDTKMTVGNLRENAYGGIRFSTDMILSMAVEKEPDLF